MSCLRHIVIRCYDIHLASVLFRKRRPVRNVYLGCENLWEGIEEVITLHRTIRRVGSVRSNEVCHTSGVRAIYVSSVLNICDCPVKGNRFLNTIELFQDENIMSMVSTSNTSYDCFFYFIARWRRGDSHRKSSISGATFSWCTSSFVI